MCSGTAAWIAREQKRELNNQGIWLREGERAAADGQYHRNATKFPDCVILDGGAGCGVSDLGTTDF